MRLAHLSDIHVTLPPASQPLRTLWGKRVAGTINYYAGNRRAHFAGVEDRITTLLADVEAQQVDHALCTGDVSAMSLEDEFARCAALLGDRLQAPGRWTVLPGNHDRYTQDAAGAFERHLGPLADAGAGYPFTKALPDKVTLVALDAARPVWLLDSSGLCGERQLGALRAILADGSLRDRFVILALHYSFLRADGRPETRSHGIRDQEALVALLASGQCHVDLVLHGHTHHAFFQAVGAVPVHCAGSATDLGVPCGYNVLDIDPRARRVQVRRRAWDRAAGAYVDG
jgi:3',5'-cyclic AMP phosphodiesterase CpdA